MTQQTASVTLEGPENLIRHIEGLQNTLTKRNEQIAHQQAEIERLEDGEPSQEGLKEAYRKGYKAAWKEAEEALYGIRHGIQTFVRDRYSAILNVDASQLLDEEIRPDRDPKGGTREVR